MKILYLSQYFPPEMGAPSARVYELSRRWVQKGKRVVVLTGFPHHPTGKIPPSYRQHFFKREEIDGINVVRTYVFPTANKGFLKRIMSYISFMGSALLLGSWHIGKIDMIIATSPQFFVAIAGYIISKIKNKPFILEIRDIWPESIVQLGQIKNEMIIKILELIEVFLYKKSNSIIVVAESSIPILNNKGIPTHKIKVIKNGVDLNLFNPQKQKSKLRVDLNLQDKFVVSYIGTLGLSHGLDKVLDAAAMLSSHKKIHLLLIGEGAEKTKLIHLSKNLGLENISFINQIDKQDLPFYYSMSDLVLVTLKKLDLFQCVIPSKIFEIMAMAKPILISVEGEAKDLVVDQAEAGLFVQPEDPEEMSKEILRLSSDRELCLKLGKNGFDFVKLNYNRLYLADQYLKYLEQNINRSNSNLKNTDINS